MSLETLTAEQNAELDLSRHPVLGGDVAKKQQELEAQLRKYNSKSAPAIKWLEFGLWYTEHKKLFVTIITFTLSITAAVLWSFCLYLFVYYMFLGAKDAQENYAALTNFDLKSSRIVVPEYGYDFVKAIQLVEGKYDYIGTVQNKMTKGWLSFDYYFDVDGQRTEGGSDFVFPNESKNVIALGQAVAPTSYNVKLVLENVSYHPFTYRKMPDWEAYKTSHLVFSVKDQKFISGNDIGLSEKLPVNRVKFSINNDSAYTYKGAQFIVMLKSRGEILAVDRYLVNLFKSKTTENAEITVYGRISGVDEIDVEPNINIINPSVFGRIY